MDKIFLKHIGIMLVISFILVALFSGTSTPDEQPLDFFHFIGMSIAATLIPLILVSIPAGIYKLIKKDSMPAFYISLWVIWVIIRALVLLS